MGTCFQEGLMLITLAILLAIVMGCAPRASLPARSSTYW